MKCESAIDFYLLLEYIKLFFTPQFVIGVICFVIFLYLKKDIVKLIDAIIDFDSPWFKFKKSQVNRNSEERISTPVPDVPDTTSENFEGLTLKPEVVEKIRELFHAERAKATLWEYRFLNYYLVPKTQTVLDWLITKKENITREYFHAHFVHLIPQIQERNAILNALESHQLISIDGNGIIKLEPKGYSYAEWRSSFIGGFNTKK